MATDVLEYRLKSTVILPIPAHFRSSRLAEMCKAVGYSMRRNLLETVGERQRESLVSITT